MMKRVVTLLNFYILLSTSLLAQNRPPAEVDKAIRATVDVLINPSATDYSAFIKSYYSPKQISNVGLDSLVSHLKEVKKSTTGAGGVDVANDNGVIQIILSEGVDAIVELVWVKDNPGKIHSLNLAKKKGPSAMTADENYENALQGRLRKIESLPNYTSNAEFEDFITENFSTSYISQNPIGEIVLLLRKLSVSVASASMLGVKRAADGKGAILELRGGKSADVLVNVEENAPFGINRFEVDNNVSFLNKKEDELFPVTWADYKDLLKQEASRGFSGVVLLAHNGNIVHQKGYGLANKEAGVENNDQIIFDIGSIPIDFTRAAILKLVDQGKISYTDPISKFIEHVPNDKKLITIEHLITGRSGLHNFHGDGAKDEDQDLTWISRDEAINRMLSRALLFKPGTDVSPSHSGYGLLAAIVEIASSKTYEAFLNENFFIPLKMKNTGPYGDESGLNPLTMAVGYGKQASQPNIPTNWGATSWLVKGSGGMVSNPTDLYLWNKGLHSGKILSQKSKDLYSQGKISIGGSERGFFTAYLRSPDNTVIICSNSDRAEYPDAMRLFQSLASLYKLK